MGFFKRLFSADYRAAVAAEAAGDLELAAERYALAGYHDAAARMHMARAERASSHDLQIEALRDALHWAPEEGELRAPACKALGEALLARARSEGVATERDRDRVREAARLLEQAGEHGAAGDAWESIGADQDAARAYGAGGLVGRLERILARGSDEADRERAVRQAFSDYQLHMKSGARDAAADALRVCLEHAEKVGEYRRLLDELESRLISGGHVVLKARRGTRAIVAARSPVLIGRDSLCDLPLRAGGISRRHAEIALTAPGEGGARFLLTDAGSRNGTLIGGLAIRGAVPLIDSGELALGDVYVMTYQATAQPATLVLRVTRGLDQGTVMVVCEEGQRIDLAAVAELPLSLVMRNGRPLVEAQPADPSFTLNGHPAVVGATQLLHGDVLIASGVEIEVE